MTPFRKYEGAGNDFILLDARNDAPPAPDQATIERWCDRHFGIGADGLMLLRNHPDYDFEMVYYNSDGRPSSMCGNGGRCIVRFAADLGIHREEYRFMAVDGPHRARLTEDGQVALEMSDVRGIRPAGDRDVVLDTGSPHYVRFVPDLGAVDVVREGRALRNSPAFAAAGINVNFVRAAADGKLSILTYERGVEDETLACGTGVTAAAVASVHRSKALGQFDVRVRARGGTLRVSGVRTGPDTFTEIWLTGPATYVFRGELPALGQ